MTLYVCLLHAQTIPIILVVNDSNRQKPAAYYFNAYRNKTQLSQKCILKKYPLLRTLIVGEQKVELIGQRRFTDAHTPVRGNPRKLKVVQLNSRFCFIVTVDLGCTDSQVIILKLQQKHIAEPSNDNSYSHRTK